MGRQVEHLTSRKSQTQILPNPKQIQNPKVWGFGSWDLFGSIGNYWDLGFYLWFING